MTTDRTLNLCVGVNGNAAALALNLESLVVLASEGDVDAAVLSDNMQELHGYLARITAAVHTLTG